MGDYLEYSNYDEFVLPHTDLERFAENLVRFMEYGPFQDSVEPDGLVTRILSFTRRNSAGLFTQYLGLRHDAGHRKSPLPFLQFEISPDDRGDVLRLHQALGTAHKVDRSVIETLCTEPSAKGIGLNYLVKNVQPGATWIIFDLEGPIIPETLDALADRYDVGPAVKKMTAAEMAGDGRTFENSVVGRLRLIAAAAEAAGERLTPKYFSDYGRRAPLREGMPELTGRLREDGYNIAIISGGFSLVAEQVASRIMADLYVANELVFKDGLIDPGATVITVNGNKDEALRVIAGKHRPSQVFYVGDGSNDVAAMRMEGVIGIATHDAYDVAKSAASHILPGRDMRAVYEIVRGFQNSC